MPNSEINLVNFKMLFSEGYEDNVDHPDYARSVENGFPIKKHVVRLNKKTLEKRTPFATIFSNRGWNTYECVFNKELPEEYKVVYKSKYCTNSTHPESGNCQFIVVVDKNDKD